MKTNDTRLGLIIVFTLSFFATTYCLAKPASIDDLGGNIIAKLDNQTVVFPLLKTVVDADIQGNLVAVTVTQTYTNPTTQPVNAKYLFPLNKDAAVYAMRMEIGDKIIRAEIQQKQKARETYKAAKRSGKNAALLEQHRPNMFTQQVANIMPGQPIKVVISYTHTVNKIDDQYQLVIPTLVGPRFTPPAQQEDLTSDNQQTGKWQFSLPPYPVVSGLHIPEQIDADRLTIKVKISSPTPIFHAQSDTHLLTTHALDDKQWTILLANRTTIDNRDFVLNYSIANDDVGVGMLSHYDDNGGYFSLQIEPPKAPTPSQITPREMVFVLDCSGSMSGQPMNDSKAFMRAALKGLRPTDSFRIIRFSDSATEFSQRPLPATANNIEKGIRYTNQLFGSGGTMMSSGIYQALNAPPENNALRMVTFLTDGYIGNEADILSLLHKHIGNTRLYALGVGTSVNRYLLDEMAKVGRGFVRYVDPTLPVEEVATSLAARLDAPVFTDIQIDWRGMQPTDVFPNPIPDLFAGQTIRIQGRYDTPGSIDLRISGKINGQEATLPVNTVLTDNRNDGEAIKLIWARSQIQHWMNQLNKPTYARTGGASNAAIEKQVTDLGLTYRLATQWTSFVAVSEKIVNTAAADTPTRDIPLPQVKGVSGLAYSPKGTFSGNATPEPAAWLGLLAGLGMLSGFRLLRRWRK